MIGESAGRDEEILLTAYLKFEFSQSVRFAVFRGRHGAPNGISQGSGTDLLVRLDDAIDRGKLRPVSCDWDTVLARGDELSEKHAIAFGCRSLDIFHVASALHFKARTFFSFDLLQRRLATAEGLIVPE